MFRRKLCPHCKTGKRTYELDSKSPECPYLGCHNGKKCAMYVPLEKEEKNGFLRRLFRKGSCVPPPRKFEPYTLI